MPSYLVVASPKHRGMAIALETDLFVIGSNPECQLRSGHPDVAGEHCALVNQGIGVYANGLCDTPPATLNGEPLSAGQETLIHQGDHLAVGPMEFVYGTHEPDDEDDLDRWALELLGGPSEETEEETVEEEAIEEPEEPEEVPERPLIAITQERGRLVAKLHVAELSDEETLARLNAELRGEVTRPNQDLLIDCKEVKEVAELGSMLLAVWAGWMTGRGGSMALCRLLPELQGKLKPLGSLGRVRFLRDPKAALEATW